MGAIAYLYRRIFVNRVRKAFRKPVTYVYLVFILVYFTMIPMSLRSAAEAFGMDTPEGMTTVLTLLAFWIIPANLIAYAKRKGLVYRNCDVHFLFPAPVSPKCVLLYAHLRTLAMQILLNCFAMVCGILMFHVEVWRLAVYFLFSILVENMLEGGIMLLLYGSERLEERHRSMVVKAAYALVGVFVLMAVYIYLKNGLSFRAVAAFLHSDMVQLVPVAGWYIAVIHLIFSEVTVVNAAGTVCYVLLLILVLTAARRMKCTGGFYEDAIKFAEDYEEVLESSRQGNIRRLGKKEKFGKASVNWRGKGARALFYRQLLEYKKKKYFIFDVNTFTAVLASAGMVYLYIHEGGFGELGVFQSFVIPAVSAYMIFIFTSINGKWARELLSPYTYLIPDTVFRKMMNATAMQHIQSLVNGCLITIPGAVVMGLDPVVTVLGILFYVVLSANKLYALAVAEIVAGNTLGRAGRQLLQMLIQSIAILMAVAGGVMGMAMGGVLSAYVMMNVFMALVTILCMTIAVLNFYNMEKV